MSYKPVRCNQKYTELNNQRIGSVKLGNKLENVKDLAKYPIYLLLKRKNEAI